MSHYYMGHAYIKIYHNIWSILILKHLLLFSEIHFLLGAKHSYLLNLTPLHGWEMRSLRRY